MEPIEAVAGGTLVGRGDTIQSLASQFREHGTGAPLIATREFLRGKQYVVIDVNGGAHTSDATATPVTPRRGIFSAARGVTSVALIGSVARREAGPSSDVDILIDVDPNVLIDVDPNVRFSLIDLVDVKALLEHNLQRRVDIVTRGGLDPRLGKRVLKDAETVF